MNTYFDHAARVIRQEDPLGLVMAIAPMLAGCCGEGYGGKALLVNHCPIVLKLLMNATGSWYWSQVRFHKP